MKPIEVTYSMARLDEIGHEIPANCEVLDKLRKAGIPAAGRVSVQGVERGVLTIKRDRVFGDVIYTWHPPEDDEDDDSFLNIDDDPAAGL